MRRRRLARLEGLNNSTAAASSSNTIVPTSPSTPEPSKAFAGSISPSIQQQLQHAELPMEVEECNDKQCNITEMDNSGIENMEVDEDRKDTISRSRVSNFTMKKNNMDLLIKSRKNLFSSSSTIEMIYPLLFIYFYCCCFRRRVLAQKFRQITYILSYHVSCVYRGKVL